MAEQIIGTIMGTIIGTIISVSSAPEACVIPVSALSPPMAAGDCGRQIERPGVENADSVVDTETRLRLLAVTQSYASTLIESAVRQDLDRYSDSTRSRLEAQ